MKKIAFILLFLSTCVVNIAQDLSWNNMGKSDFILKNKILSIKISQLIPSLDGDSTVIDEIYHFDKNGFLELYEFADSNIVREVRWYFYDYKNQLVKTIDTLGKNKEITKNFFIYDKNGREIEKRRERLDVGTKKVTIDSIKYFWLGNIKYRKDTVCFEPFRVVYDERKNIIETEMTKLSDVRFPFVEKYKFDTDNLLTEQNLFLSNGEFIGRQQYFYFKNKRIDKGEWADINGNGAIEFYYNDYLLIKEVRIVHKSYSMEPTSYFYSYTFRK